MSFTSALPAQNVLLKSAVARAHSVTLEETVYASDSVSAAAGRVVTLRDHVVGEHWPEKLRGKLLTDALRVGDAAYRGAGKRLLDSVRQADRLSKSAAAALADHALSCDRLSKSVLAVERDSLAAADELAKAPSRLLRDSSAAADYLSRAPLKALRDASIPADYAAKAPLKVLADAAGGLDYLSKTASLTLADYTVLADYLSKLLLEVLTDASKVADYLTKAAHLFKHLADALAVLDAAYRTLGKSLRDYVVGEHWPVSLRARNIYEVLRVADKVARAPARALRDAPGLADALARAPARALLDGLRLADALAPARHKALHLLDRVFGEHWPSRRPARAVTDCALLADYLSKAPAPALLDSAGLADLLSKVPARALLDSLKPLDSLLLARGVSLHLLDRVFGEHWPARSPARAARDRGRLVDMRIYPAFTLEGVWLRRVRAFEVIRASDYNSLVDAARVVLRRADAVVSALHDSLSDDAKSAYEAARRAASRMSYVRPGAVGTTEMFNVFTDFIVNMYSVLKECLSIVEERRGETLYDLRFYLSALEVEMTWLPRLRSGDIYSSRHQNAIVNSLKLLWMLATGLAAHL